MPAAPGHPAPRPGRNLLLRKRIYTGDFEWKGKVLQGTHPAIVSRELWQQVQDVLDGRATKRTKRPKRRRHQFAFSGLIQCGLSGSSISCGPAYPRSSPCGWALGEHPNRVPEFERGTDRVNSVLSR